MTPSVAPLNYAQRSAVVGRQLILISTLLLASCASNNTTPETRNGLFERADFICEIGMSCEYEGLYDTELLAVPPAMPTAKVLTLQNSARQCVPFLLDDALYAQIETQKMLFEDANVGIKISGQAIKREAASSDAVETYQGRKISASLCRDKPYIIFAETFDVFVLSMP